MQGVLPKMTTTREIRSGDNSSLDKDQSENHGMDVENMHGNSVIINVMIT